MSIVLLSGATLAGTDLEFPRVGATYREVSTMQNMPDLVTVVDRGPNGWCLIGHGSPKENKEHTVHQTWLNFNLVVVIAEEMFDSLKQDITNSENLNFEKPTGIYP